MSYSVCRHSHALPSHPFNDILTRHSLEAAMKEAEAWMKSPKHLVSIYGPDGNLLKEFKPESGVQNSK